MKRFYCVICVKNKRVRILPPMNNSEGMRCRFHNSGKSRALVNSRVRFVKHLGSTRRISAGQQKSKSKK